MRIFIRLALSTIAVIVAAYVLPGVVVDSVMTALVVAVVLGVVNAVLRPILVLLTFPITLVTLGIFLFVINAAMIILVDRLVPGFEVLDFWWALLFSLVVSLVGSFLNAVAGD